jgi:hypothetical protein
MNVLDPSNDPLLTAGSAKGAKARDERPPMREQLEKAKHWYLA